LSSLPAVAGLRPAAHPPAAIAALKVRILRGITLGFVSETLTKNGLYLAPPSRSVISDRVGTDRQVDDDDDADRF
jgi:hypothetical protein